METSSTSSFKSTLSQQLYLIRGIAIVLVVIGHVIGNEKKTGIRQMYDSDLVGLRWLCEFIYTFHIPVFFIVSGVAYAVFSKKDISYLKFAKSRLIRLVIPLLCWAPLTLIFQSLSKGVQFSFIDIVNSVIQPYFIFWFFHALLFVSTLHFIIYKIFKNDLLYLLIAICLFIGSLYFQETQLLQIYGYFNIFYAFGLFIARFLPKANLAIEKLSTVLTFILMFWCVALMLIINYLIGVDYSLLVKFFNGIIGFILMYIIANFSSNKVGKVGNALIYKVKDSFFYLGKASMTIYVLHIPFGSGTRVILQKIFSITEPHLHFLLGCAAAIMGSVLVHKVLCDRSKLFRYSIGESK